MKYLKSQLLIANPAGIDKEIQKIQIYLPSKISYLEARYSFGRAERNKVSKDSKKEQERRPEIIVGENKYIELFPDTSVNCSSFFYQKSANRINSGAYLADVDLIVFADLQKIGYNSGIKVVNDFMKYLKLSQTDVSILGIKEKADQVFADFSFSNNQFIDMQPYYIFSLQLKIKFSIQNIC